MLTLEKSSSNVAYYFYIELIESIGYGYVKILTDSIGVSLGRTLKPSCL